jgi:HAMP domain-containing protein
VGGRWQAERRWSGTGLVRTAPIRSRFAFTLIVPLGRLRDAAHEVALGTLPGVVRRLQDDEAVDLATEATGPIQVGSTDEIGQLAEAFNSVHRVAV